MVALALIAIFALWWRSDAGSGFLDPPAPEVMTDDEGGLPPAPTGSLAAPLGIPLSRLEALLNDAVPGGLGSLDERRELPDRDRTEIAFAPERGDLEGRMDGSTSRVEGIIEYALRACCDSPILPEVRGSSPWSRPSKKTGIGARSRSWAST